MGSVIAPIAALLLGAAILLLGQGLFLVLIPLALAEAGQTAQAVGLTVSAYFTGFVFGAWSSAKAIHRVGYIRAYGGLIAVVLTAALALPLYPDLLTWIVLRFVHGAAVSGVFVAIESWLNTAVASDWRGRVLGTYSFISLAALGAGQLLLNIYGTTGFAAFNVGAILLGLSIIPVVLSRIAAPAAPGVEVKLNLKLMRQVPLGLAVGFLSGWLTGSFWAMAPLFAASALPEMSAATGLISTALLGGILLQVPVGYLSDKTDRRRIILGVAIAAAATSLAVIVMDAYGPAPLYASFFIYGGMIFSLHPLALAHCADRAAGAEEMLSLSQGMLLANGLGLASGPMLSASLTKAFGPDGLFLFATAATLLGAASVGVRLFTRSPVPVDERSDFLPAIDSTPAQIAMDPRASLPDSEVADGQDRNLESTDSPQ